MCVRADLRTFCTIRTQSYSGRQHQTQTRAGQTCSAAPLTPQSCLNTAHKTHLFLPGAVTGPETPLPAASPCHAPSVFSSTVLCFTKATSPAPSARHLQRRNQ